MLSSIAFNSACFHWTSRPARTREIVLKKLFGFNATWLLRLKQYEAPSRPIRSKHLAMVCATADFPDPATPLRTRIRRSFGVLSERVPFTQSITSHKIPVLVPVRQLFSIL